MDDRPRRKTLTPIGGERVRYTDNGPAKRMASSIAMAAAGLVILVLGALVESAGS